MANGDASREYSPAESWLWERFNRVLYLERRATEITQAKCGMELSSPEYFELSRELSDVYLELRELLESAG